MLGREAAAGRRRERDAPRFASEDAPSLVDVDFESAMGELVGRGEPGDPAANHDDSLLAGRGVRLQMGSLFRTRGRAQMIHLPQRSRQEGAPWRESIGMRFPLVMPGARS